MNVAAPPVVRALLDVDDTPRSLEFPATRTVEDGLDQESAWWFRSRPTTSSTATTSEKPGEQQRDPEEHGRRVQRTAHRFVQVADVLLPGEVERQREVCGTVHGREPAPDLDERPAPTLITGRGSPPGQGHRPHDPSGFDRGHDDQSTGHPCLTPKVGWCRPLGLPANARRPGPRRGALTARVTRGRVRRL
jgi:hypothetical protein